MKKRHISATLLMAMALAGCGVNSTSGVATPNGPKASYGLDAQQNGTAIEARYHALNAIIICPPDLTLTGSDQTSTGSTTTSSGAQD